jgi:hypothetical protein
MTVKEMRPVIRSRSPALFSFVWGARQHQKPDVAFSRPRPDVLGFA